jgi:hypothetical protein
MRLSRQSEGLDATRQVEDDEDQDVPQDVSSEEPTRTL